MSAAAAGSGGLPPTPGRGEGAPPRPFNCLWCGRPHTPRTADDLEAFALLCPDCIGRAQDNDFLRYRLREGLRARGQAQAAAGRGTAEPPAEAAAEVAEPADAATADTAVEAADTAVEAADMRAYYAARAAEYDEKYTRHGPLESLSFGAELDAATLWLDGLPLRGEIVELAAGTGWWSPLLAQKGELWLYDAVEEPLELARQRLVAHGLRAHIHLRDAWAEPDRAVDGLFCGFWLSHVRAGRLADFMTLARRWLKPGGLVAFIDEAPGWVDRPAGSEIERRAVGEHTFDVVKVTHSAADYEAALRGAAFADIEIRATGRHFLLGRARAA